MSPEDRERALEDLMGHQHQCGEDCDHDHSHQHSHEHQCTDNCDHGHGDGHASGIQDDTPDASAPSLQSRTETATD